MRSVKPFKLKKNEPVIIFKCVGDKAVTLQANVISVNNYGVVQVTCKGVKSKHHYMNVRKPWLQKKPSHVSKSAA